MVEGYNWIPSLLPGREPVPDSLRERGERGSLDWEVLGAINGVDLTLKRKGQSEIWIHTQC